MDEAAYKKYLSENGIEVEEDTTVAQQVETKPDVDEEVDEESNDTKSEDTQETTKPKQKEAPKKDSIYTEYKNKKRALREKEEEVQTISEKNTILEKELQEKNAKIAELQQLANKATTSVEKQEVKDGIEALAEEYSLDRSFLNKLSSELLKKVKPAETQTIDPEYTSKVKQIVETQEFNQEFEETLPFIEETFGKLSKDDVKNLRTELDKLAHSKGFNDKDLDYIIFKNRSQLSSIITPKRRGIETRTQNEEKSVDEEPKIDFNQAPDFDNMTEAQVKAWETEYKKLKSNTKGLTTGPNGKKFFI